MNSEFDVSDPYFHLDVLGEKFEEHMEKSDGARLAHYFDEATGWQSELRAPMTPSMQALDLVVQDADGNLCYEDSIDFSLGVHSDRMLEELRDGINKALAANRGCFQYRAGDSIPKDGSHPQPNRIYGELRDRRTGAVAQFGTTGILGDKPYIKILTAVMDKDGNLLSENTQSPDAIHDWSEKKFKTDLRYALWEAEKEAYPDQISTFETEESLRFNCIKDFIRENYEHKFSNEHTLDSLTESWNSFHEKDGKRIAGDITDASYLLEETEDRTKNAPVLERLGVPFSTEDSSFWMDRDGKLVSGTAARAAMEIFSPYSGEYDLASSLAWNDTRSRDFPLESAYSIEARIRAEVQNVLYDNYSGRNVEPKTKQVGLANAQRAAQYLLTHDFKAIQKDVMSVPSYDSLRDRVKDVLFAKGKKPTEAAVNLGKRLFMGLSFDQADKLLSADKRVRDNEIKQAKSMALEAR